jgi:foldase protein PrsA
VRLILGGNMKLKRLAALALTGVITLTTVFGCGANTNKTIATLGDEKVTFGVANFIVKYQKASVDDMYAMYAGFYGVDSLWSTDTSGSGSTTEVEFKQSAMDLLHEMYTLKAHLADYGIEITAEDEAAIKEAAAAFMAANTEAAIKEFGATEEIVVEALKLYTIQAKMYNKIIEGADRNVSDEAANMRGYSMMHIDLSGYYDKDSNWVEYTEDEAA